MEEGVSLLGLHYEVFLSILLERLLTGHGILPPFVCMTYSVYSVYSVYRGYV